MVDVDGWKIRRWVFENGEFATECKVHGNLGNSVRVNRRVESEPPPVYVIENVRP
jgi:hypothetical protein